MSQNKKDIVFYYLDTLIDSSDVEIKRDEQGNINSVGSKFFFYINVRGNDIWFNRKEAFLICKMFDIDSSILDLYLNWYFSKKFNLDMNDNHIEYFNTKNWH
jgi:hypothetical protein